MLNTDTIETFINYLKSQKGYSDHTIRNYRIDLKQFLDFLIEKGRLAGKEKRSADLESIDFLTIRGYLGNLFGRYKRTTIARKLSTLRSFFYYLERRGMGAGNPAADISTPRQGKYIPTYLPVDEMFRLLEAPDKEKPLGLRDQAIIEVFYSCGIRVSELAGLNFSSSISDPPPDPPGLLDIGPTMKTPSSIEVCPRDPPDLVAGLSPVPDAVIGECESV